MVKSAYAQLMFRLGGTDEQPWRAPATTSPRSARAGGSSRSGRSSRRRCEELINPYVYAEAAALIGEHQAAGRDVVLVSASGEEMVRPIGELLGVTDVIATRMGIVDGRYSGEVEFYAAGPTKVDGVRELAKERGYDLPTVTPTRTRALTCRCWRRSATRAPSTRTGPAPGRG